MNACVCVRERERESLGEIWGLCCELRGWRLNYKMPSADDMTVCRRARLCLCIPHLLTTVAWRANVAPLRCSHVWRLETAYTSHGPLGSCSHALASCLGPWVGARRVVVYSDAPSEQDTLRRDFETFRQSHASSARLRISRATQICYNTAAAARPRHDDGWGVYIYKAGGFTVHA